MIIFSFFYDSRHNVMLIRYSVFAACVSNYCTSAQFHVLSVNES